MKGHEYCPVSAHSGGRIDHEVIDEAADRRGRGGHVIAGSRDECSERDSAHGNIGGAGCYGLTRAAKVENGTLEKGFREIRRISTNCLKKGAWGRRRYGNWGYAKKLYNAVRL